MDSVRLIAIHDILNERINRVAEEQKRIEFIEGPQGRPGKDGKDGKNGLDGKEGRDGKDGKDGVDGVDGKDGISITDASVDVDGHLTITLSNGDEIDAGDLTLFLGNDRIEIRSSVGGGSNRDLDLTSNAITGTFVAAEALDAGDICHLNSSGEMEKADATNSTKSFSMLSLAATAMSAAQTGTFLIKGVYAISAGFSAGDTLFLAASPGEMTAIAPNVSGNINRVAGYATSSTQIFFDPDKTWMEIN